MLRRSVQLTRGYDARRASGSAIGIVVTLDGPSSRGSHEGTGRPSSHRHNRPYHHIRRAAANTFGANGSFGGTRYPIPAGRFDRTSGTWVGGFRLRNSYPAGGDPVMDSFLSSNTSSRYSAFRPTSVGGGPVQINDLGWTGSTLNAELDANQTFTFLP